MDAMDTITYAVRIGDTLYQLASLYKTTVDAIVSANPGVDFRKINLGSLITIPRKKMIDMLPPEPKPEPARVEPARPEPVRTRFPAAVATAAQPYAAQNVPTAAQPHAAQSVPTAAQPYAAQNVPAAHSYAGQREAPAGGPDAGGPDAGSPDAGSPGTESAGNGEQARRREGEEPRRLRDAMRLVWGQSAEWTRMAMISAAHGLPDRNAAESRLLRNADDLEALLRPYYGTAGAAKIGGLFREHLTTALQLTRETGAGNTPAAEETEKRWYRNADEIAGAIHAANPYIPEEMFRNMLRGYLALTKAEAQARAQGDYARDIQLYGQAERQAAGTADILSDGVIRQFPFVF